MRRLDLLLYPELGRLDPAQRETALRRARSRPLDLVELTGMAAAIVLVTSVTSYGAPAGFVERFSAGLAGFLVALALLAVTAGPFLYQRTRRGLREELREPDAGAAESR